MNKFVFSRFREPSTWIGAGLVLQYAAQAVATKDPQAIGAAVAGVLGMLMPEQKGAGRE